MAVKLGRASSFPGPGRRFNGQLAGDSSSAAKAFPIVAPQDVRAGDGPPPTQGPTMNCLPLMIPLDQQPAIETGPSPAALADVHLPTDLPPWWVLGELDAAAFESTEERWVARWANPSARSSIHLQYHRASGRARLRHQFLGSELFEIRACEAELEGLARRLLEPVPLSWDEALRTALLPWRVDLPPRYSGSRWMLPFGPLLTLVVPVPYGEIPRLQALLAARVANTPADRCTGLVGFTGCSLRYDDSRRPHWFTSVNDAEALFRKSTHLPARVREFPLRDGRPGWFVERPVYLALLVIPMAGIVKTVEWLHEERFVRSAAEAKQLAFKGPFGEELSAFLLTTDALDDCPAQTVQSPVARIDQMTYSLGAGGMRLSWFSYLGFARDIGRALSESGFAHSGSGIALQASRTAH